MPGQTSMQKGRGLKSVAGNEPFSDKEIEASSKASEKLQFGKLQIYSQENIHFCFIF